MSGEQRILRERHEDLGDEADRLEDSGREGSSVLARTRDNGSYPTAAACYFAVETVDVGGPEGEGDTPAYTPRGDVFFALNIGTAVPPVGTEVLATCIDGRWVFHFNG